MHSVTESDGVSAVDVWLPEPAIGTLRVGPGWEMLGE